MIDLLGGAVCGARHPSRRETVPFCRETEPFRRETVPFCRETEPFRRETVPFCREMEPFRRETVPFRREMEGENRLSTQRNRYPTEKRAKRRCRVATEMPRRGKT